MIIDLTKMIYNNLYKIPIDGVINICDDAISNTDIRRISPVKVNGFLYNNDEEYELNINIKGEMILPCARTLKDVKYPFDIDINEIIDEKNEFDVKIIQNRLDIFPIIWENILMEIPMRVVSPDAEDIKLSGDGWKLITDEEVTSSPFAELAEMFNDREVK